MQPFKDISGQVFGRLTAVRYSGQDKHNDAQWQFLCSCGGECVGSRRSAERGMKRSCGCLRREENSSRKKIRPPKIRKTPQIEHPLFILWIGMMSRCRYPKDERYARYGGRGIKVCERWRSFRNFAADMGERPAGTSLNRINNDGDYEPGNCNWATVDEQQNNRSDNVRLTHDGKSLTIAQWARLTGLPDSLIRARLDRMHWSIEQALTTPPRPYSKARFEQQIPLTL